MSHNVRSSTRLVAEVMNQMMGVNCTICTSDEFAVTAAGLHVSGELTAALELLVDPGVAQLAADIGLAIPSTEVTNRGGSQALDTQMAANEIADFLTQVGAHVGRLERDAVASLAAMVLTDRGYAVQTEIGDIATGVEAFLGDEVFLVAVLDGGETLVDQAGALDCAQRMEEFEADMEKAGALLTRVTEVPHDPAHGPLIAEAAAAGEASLASGIARHATHGIKSTRQNRIIRQRGSIAQVANAQWGPS